MEFVVSMLEVDLRRAQERDRLGWEFGTSSFGNWVFKGEGDYPF